MVQSAWWFPWDGHHTETEESFSDSMGWPSEMSSSQWQSLIHPDDLTGVLLDWGANYHRRRPVLLKFRMLDAWGEWRWIISIGQPDPSGDGYHGFFLIGESVGVFACN